MKNDNASRQVIDMTNDMATSHVRFYFRPLTPTQYYNEGFKHERLRYDHDAYANVPVPVFFFFDLIAILEDHKTEFSECQQSGTGSKLCHTAGEFEQFDFGRIYGTEVPTREDISFRHAEILYPEFYDIDRSLSGIACRNELEKSTFLNLLRDSSESAYYKYKNIVRVVRENLFEKNGIYVNNIDYFEDKVGVQFSHTKEKWDYMQNMLKRFNLTVSDLDPIHGVFTFDWLKEKTNLYHREFSLDVLYQEGKTYTFTKVPLVMGADVLQIRVWLDTKLMGYVQYDLGGGSII